MFRLRHPAAATLLAALLVACGGDNGSNPQPKTTVVVSPATQTRVAGETHQFTATVNGTAATPGQVVWSSSNTAVATVDPTTGLATTVAAGSTKIRATVNGAYGEGDLNVIANTAPNANAGADVDVDRGGTVALAGSGTDPQGQAVTFKWTQIGGPDVTGGAGFLTGAAPTFAAPSTVSVLRFSLVASDGFLNSTPDTVLVYVLEDRTKALWVSPAGNDANGGTRAAPFRTIAAALTAAVGSGADVYVAEGSYPSVVLRTGVSMYGGFASDWSARYTIGDVAHRSIIGSSTMALVANAVSDLTVDGFEIAGGDAAGGLSSYGVVVDASQRITISGNAIHAGAGAAGASGASGPSGTIGAAGQNATTTINPGLGGGNGGSGGRGGSSSTSATGGNNGGSPGGVGGAPASPPTPGGAGGNGGVGASGANGGGGSAIGTFTANGYVPSRGASGTMGAFGGGGGGGGGGGYVYVFPAGYEGGGGGGGGGGGSGGQPGTGGAGGGGSFGVALIGSTEITIVGNTITAANGGAGGAGGTGGAGGPGGPGGAGYDPSATVDGREGGRGGAGGPGGSGGSGGGGGGGPSIGIAADGSSAYTATSNTITRGNGGAAGSPNGQTGLSATTATVP